MYAFRSPVDGSERYFVSNDELIYTMSSCRVFRCCMILSPARKMMYVSVAVVYRMWGVFKEAKQTCARLIYFLLNVLSSLRTALFQHLTS